MLRRILAGAVLAGAAATVAAAAPANAAEPNPLSGAISAQTCRAGGGTPHFPPYQPVGPGSIGTCLGGVYSLTTVVVPIGGVPGLF
jgi:hypothetical protein